MNEEPVKQLRADIEKIADTEHGQAFFRWLASRCGVFMPSVVLNKENEAAINSTLINEAYRGMWLEIQQLIPYRLLAPILLPEPVAEAKPTEKQKTQQQEQDKEWQAMKRPQPKIKGPMAHQDKVLRRGQVQQ